MGVHLNEATKNQTFASGPHQIRIPDHVHAQILELTYHWLQLYSLVQYDVFKMMIRKLFYFDLSGKNVCQKILRSKIINEV